MQTVMKRFDAAVREVAEKEDYDLIGEVGFIEGVRLPNITSKVVKAVKAQPKDPDEL